MEDGILKGVRVLVVEDDYFQAGNVRRSLEAGGAVVVGPCRDAKEAMALVAEARPDCAVLDINLGAGPSFKLASAVVAAGAPVVFLSGYDSADIPEEFDACPRLQKPAQPSQLVAAVAEACTKADQTL